MRRLAHLAAGGLLITALAACGTTDPDDPTTAPGAGQTAPADPTDDTEATVKPTPGDQPIKTIGPKPGAPGGDLPTAVPDGVAERDDVLEAVEQEAERAGVSADEVEVVGYADVTWRDGSIGCPKPGMMYTQALVPGHQLILSVDGQLASYHAAKDKPFAYCANPSAPLPAESS